MTGKTLNLLNIGLMIISCLIAFVLPFELFLFSYAVLGPLHYLTEIGWLHKRNYFIKGKYDFLWLVLLSLLISLSYLGVQRFDKVGQLVPFIAFCSALTFVMVKDVYLKVLAVMLSFIAVAFLKDSMFFLIFFLIFLPTILHVFLFTGSFIFYGALKSKSTTGIISLVVFIACAVSFFVIVPDASSYKVSELIRSSYADFTLLNQYLIRVFGLGELNHLDSQGLSVIFNSDTGYKVMRFIAFSYTYHYLNWFSKTSIIQWHKIDRRYLAATIVLWLAAVGLYISNYATGLKFLFFLSFLHVTLEFPLNFQTFINIGQELRSFRGGKAQPLGVARKQKTPEKISRRQAVKSS